MIGKKLKLFINSPDSIPDIDAEKCPILQHAVHLRPDGIQLFVHQGERHISLFMVKCLFYGSGKRFKELIPHLNHRIGR